MKKEEIFIEDLEDSNKEDDSEDSKLRERLRELEKEIASEIGDPEETNEYEDHVEGNLSEELNTLYQGADPLNSFFVEKERKLLGVILAFLSVLQLTRLVEKALAHSISLLSSLRLVPKLKFLSVFNRLFFARLLNILRLRMDMMRLAALSRLRRAAQNLLKSIKYKGKYDGKNPLLMKKIDTLKDLLTAISKLEGKGDKRIDSYSAAGKLLKVISEKSEKEGSKSSAEKEQYSKLTQKKVENANKGEKMKNSIDVLKKDLEKYIMDNAKAGYQKSLPEHLKYKTEKPVYFISKSGSPGNDYDALDINKLFKELYRLFTTAVNLVRHAINSSSERGLEEEGPDQELDLEEASASGPAQYDLHRDQSN